VSAVKTGNHAGLTALYTFTAGQANIALLFIQLAANVCIKLLELRAIRRVQRTRAQRTLHQSIRPIAVEIKIADRFRRQQFGIGD
jgi:hypothetical protein